MADVAEIIDRVAKAIYCASEDLDPVRSKGHIDAVFAPDSPVSMAEERRMARAAIEALKGPLPAKVWKEAYGLSDLICPSTTTPEDEINGIFATILDAALTTPPST